MNRPITAQLVGGLGNQLFTYYAVAAVAATHNAPLRIDSSRVAHGVSAEIFDLPGQWLASDNTRTLARGMRQLTQRATRRIGLQSQSLGRMLNYYESREPGDDPSLFAQRPGTTMRGYFQSWRTVNASYRLGIQRKLMLRSPSQWLLDVQRQAVTDVPVAVHVRRGDYAANNVFGLLSTGYYSEALQHLRNQGHTGPVWLFSDDLHAAKEIVPEPWVPMRSPVGPQEELLAMSSASAFVTANSSFSWWGAWLSQSSNVVAPDTWFKASPEPAGLVPPSWTRITSQWA
jgi:hypothetical protein